MAKKDVVHELPVSLRWVAKFNIGTKISKNVAEWCNSNPGYAVLVGGPDARGPMPEL